MEEDFSTQVVLWLPLLEPIKTLLEVFNGLLKIVIFELYHSLFLTDQWPDTFDHVDIIIFYNALQIFKLFLSSLHIAWVNL